MSQENTDPTMSKSLPESGAPFLYMQGDEPPGGIPRPTTKNMEDPTTSIEGDSTTTPEGDVIGYNDTDTTPPPPSDPPLTEDSTTAIGDEPPGGGGGSSTK